MHTFIPPGRKMHEIVYFDLELLHVSACLSIRHMLACLPAASLEQPQT